MLRHTAHPTEPRYEVLALFTLAMSVASLLAVAIGTLLPYIESAFPADRTHLGALMTAIMFGGMTMTVFSGMATDRFGDKAVLIVCGAIMGGSLIASAAVPSFLWVTLCFVIYGVGFAAINPVGSHAILFFFKPEERGVAMGIRQMGMPMGGVFGSMLFASAAEYWGYRGALLAAGIIILAITWFAAALYREPEALHGKPLRAGVLLKDVVRIGREPRLLLVTLVSVILFAAQVALMGFFPLTLVREAHTSAAFASIVFIISQFAAAAGRVMWGWLSDRFFHGNRMLPLIVTCVLCALAAFGVAHVGGLAIPVLAVISAALGFSAEGWLGIAICAMAEIGGEEHAGSALGFGLTFVFAAGVITPAIFQWIMETHGIPAAWHALALGTLVGIVPAWGAMVMMHRKRAALAS